MSLNLTTLYRNAKDNKFHYKDSVTGADSILEEMFPIENWDCPEAFKFANIKGYEPMTAKELETEEQQDEKLNDSSYILEEKFDGTRALVYFLSQPQVDGEDVGFCRVFSRRVSKKTGFYVENTDSLPHIRENNVPELAGTILDGEMFIEGLPFREVSSTLNCLWDKAVDRQLEKGFITFHAFDILFYKGVDLRKMTLERRKEYLHLAVEEANNEYIKSVSYHKCGNYVDTSSYVKEHGKPREVFNKLQESGDLDSYPNFRTCLLNRVDGDSLSPRAFYEYIVATGGEGLILKPLNGKYLHKRGWEYSKIKKFLTRELIVLGFEEPTKEYTGKDIRKWAYWVEKETDRRVQGNFYGDPKYMPVTKYYFHNQVGVMKLGVIISVADYENMPKNKRGLVYEIDDIVDIDGDGQFQMENYIMEVCECSGFDDETREYFTRNRQKMRGTVVEVKANELFRDSGKMRHPRFMRQRFDKNPEQCTWSDHIGVSEVTK